jgi:serine/threonine-protein kinase RsbW
MGKPYTVQGTKWREGSDVFIQVQLSFPRDARYVGTVRKLSRSILTNLDAPSEPLDELEIALSEACANAVRHAAGTMDYRVVLSLFDDYCEVEVVDPGPGFDPSMSSDPDTALLDSESGRGLLLMRALVDDFEFQREDDHMRVRLVKRFPGLGLQPS